MKRALIAVMTIALLLSACNKSAVPPAASPSPSVSPSASPTSSSSPPVTGMATVIVTFQGTVQSGVLVTESASYNYATNTPGTTLFAGTTGSSGSVNLTIGNPSGPYCFSASYVPTGQTTTAYVVNCQPTLVSGQTVTLGN